MRKWVILSTVVVAMIASSTLLLRLPSHGASNQTSSAERAPAPAAPVSQPPAAGKLAAEGRAPELREAPGQAPAAVAAANGVSEDEQAVLQMYEEMGDAMAEHTGDCKAMAESVRFSIAAHEEDVRRVLAIAANRGAQEALAADERLEGVAGPQMARFRTSINKELQRCPSELMPVLRLLSEMHGEVAR